MSAVFKREFKAYFSSPLGYVFLTIFFFFEGMFFSTIFEAGSPETSYVVAAMSTVIMFVTPVLTMRLLSEDRKQKVDQALLTAPVSVAGIIMGKFFAAFSVFALAFSPTLIFQIIVASKVTVNWLVYINMLVGVLLIGAALIAIGMFISSLTESTVISCILTLVAFLVIMMITSLAEMTGVEFLTDIAGYIGFMDRFQNFYDNVFPVTDVIYLLSIAGVFCFLSVRAVEKRRWS
ncbi:MAG: ABC transporter permease [Clostridia bacterium]|nr:ABC transporter permease [Clostridia bacterium]